jgi:hypothetical protein
MPLDRQPNIINLIIGFYHWNAGQSIDIFVNDIPEIDQLDGGSVSHDKSDTASCSNVQTE